MLERIPLVAAPPANASASPVLGHTGKTSQKN
jgi:hypothetical protein